MTQNTDDLVASFLARKAITKCETGARTIDEKVFVRHRGDRLVAVLRAPSEDDLISERHVVIGADGVEHVRNGLGEWIA